MRRRSLRAVSAKALELPLAAARSLFHGMRRWVEILLQRVVNALGMVVFPRC
jgi:hypothetical protein